MSYWLLRIGIAFVVVGLVLLSPIADALPVDFWSKLKGLFLSGTSSSSQHQFFRVVPGEPNHLGEFGIIAIGLLLVALSLYFGARK